MNDEQRAALDQGRSHTNFQRMSELLDELLDHDGPFAYEASGLMVMLIEHAMLLSISIQHEDLDKAEKFLNTCAKVGIRHAKQSYADYQGTTGTLQ